MSCLVRQVPRVYRRVCLSHVIWQYTGTAYVWKDGTISSHSLRSSAELQLEMLWLRLRSEDSLWGWDPFGIDNKTPAALMKLVYKDTCGYTLKPTLKILLIMQSVWSVKHNFHRGPITSIPLPDSTVDYIISNCVINLVPAEEKATVFQKVARILKPVEVSGEGCHIWRCWC